MPKWHFVPRFHSIARESGQVNKSRGVHYHQPFSAVYLIRLHSFDGNAALLFTSMAYIHTKDKTDFVQDCPVFLRYKHLVAKRKLRIVFWHGVQNWKMESFAANYSERSTAKRPVQVYQNSLRALAPLSGRSEGSRFINLCLILHGWHLQFKLSCQLDNILKKCS